MIRISINSFGDVTLGNGRPIGQVVQNEVGLWEGVYEDESVRGASGFVPCFPFPEQAAVEVWAAFMAQSPISFNVLPGVNA